MDSNMPPEVRFRVSRTIGYRNYDVLTYRGYLHAHISYMDEECRSCLLLLTVDRDVFFTLSECKEKIREVS